MTDRELMESAARVAGIKLWGVDEYDNFYLPESDRRWNPLTDDGDALRLAVTLRLNINFEEWDNTEFACAVPHKTHQGCDEVMDNDPQAATRRAIVRAAATMTPTTELSRARRASALE